MNTPQLEPGSIRARDGEDDLLALAATANEAYVDAERHIRAACDQAFEGGRALLAAKEKVPAGQWGSWLRDNFNGSARTARAWMQGAKRIAQAGNGKTAALPFSSLRALIASEDIDPKQSGSMSNGTRRDLPAPRLNDLKDAALQLDDKDRARLAWMLAKSLPRNLLESMVGAINEKLLSAEPEIDGGRERSEPKNTESPSKPAAGADDGESLDDEIPS